MASESDVCLRTKMYYAAIACFVGYVVLEGVFAQRHPELNPSTVTLQVVQAAAIAFVMNLPNVGTRPFFEKPPAVEFPVGVAVAGGYILIQSILSLGSMFSDLPVPLVGPLGGLVLGTAGNVIHRWWGDSSPCPGNTLHHVNYVDTLVWVLIGCTLVLAMARGVKTVTGGWQRPRLPSWFKSRPASSAQLRSALSSGWDGSSNARPTARPTDQILSGLQELVPTKSTPVRFEPSEPQTGTKAGIRDGESQVPGRKPLGATGSVPTPLELASHVPDRLNPGPMYEIPQDFQDPDLVSDNLEATAVQSAESVLGGEE